MKNKIFCFIFIILFNITLFLLLFLQYYENRSKQEQFLSAYSLNKKEISTLKNGDIILRHGYGVVSDMIVETFNKNTNVSHCGIISIQDTGIAVVHSVSQSLSDYDGVQAQNLKTFINDSKQNSVIVVRYKFDDTVLRKNIIAKLNYYLKVKKTFDHSFDLQDTTSFYCTELIFRIFKDVFDIDIFKYQHGNNEHLKFNTFMDSSLFEEVLNHHLQNKKY